MTGACLCEGDPGPEDVVLWPDQISCQESDSRGALCASTVNKDCIQTLSVTTETTWVSAAAPGGTGAWFLDSPGVWQAQLVFLIHIFTFFKLSVYLGNLQDSPVNLSSQTCGLISSPARSKAGFRFFLVCFEKLWGLFKLHILCVEESPAGRWEGKVTVHSLEGFLLVLSR